MIKTQVQIPDHLYQEAKRLARSREMSLAEVFRRGLEQLLAVYPAPDTVPVAWKMPAPRKLGCRPLTPAQLRDLARGEDELPARLAGQPRKPR